MNHYPKHIGDWRTATYNLTHQQRGIYADLLDTYYDKEQPLTADIERLSKDHGCLSEGARADLSYILERYFRLDGDVFRHERCDEEIAHFNHKSEMARVSGKKGGLTPRASRRMKRTPSEDEANAKRTLSGGLATPDPRIKKDSPDGESKESVAAAPPPAEPDPEAGQQGGPADAPKPPPLPPPSGSGQMALADPPEAKARPTRKAPKDFKVTGPMAAWVAEQCPMLSVDDVKRETAMFRDHTFARAITDWPGAWRNWVRREQKQREARAPRGGRVERQAQRDSFMDQLLKGRDDGHERRHEGTLDVESRVVRDGEEYVADEGAG